MVDMMGWSKSKSEENEITAGHEKSILKKIGVYAGIYAIMFDETKKRERIEQ
jgi:hypothetical protein